MVCQLSTVEGESTDSMLTTGKKGRKKRQTCKEKDEKFCKRCGSVTAFPRRTAGRPESWGPWILGPSALWCRWRTPTGSEKDRRLPLHLATQTHAHTHARTHTHFIIRVLSAEMHCRIWHLQCLNLKCGDSKESMQGAARDWDMPCFLDMEIFYQRKVFA